MNWEEQQTVDSSKLVAIPSVLEPFLKMGIMKELFQEAGTVPILTDCLKRGT